ncbi:cytochrome c oxidase subunit 6b-3-like [Bidens hawaiensis]|uniref:cytochrome c oxidase subunit 6b-3-like n=1 Tax=Bidens hawaiensis TaxID=980011 RepID=UPI00404B9F82
MAGPNYTKNLSEHYLLKDDKEKEDLNPVKASKVAVKPEIKLETAPADYRFPTTNQSRHCFTRYVEYHRCIGAKGEGAPECDKFAKYYRSLCPAEWICLLITTYKTACQYSKPD